MNKRTFDEFPNIKVCYINENLINLNMIKCIFKSLEDYPDLIEDFFGMMTRYVRFINILL